ncbi:TatD family hydrolase [Candidatus Saccharibacteria bacterium]|nr:TatD family hydrolase [Candidatus Saccharibacteria bacterium]
MSYLIDSHCHLHDPEFFAPELAEKMLKNAEKAGIRQVICIGTSEKDSKKAQSFAESHKNVFWTYGIHPEETNIASRGLARKNDDTLYNSKLVAIGEVGLDYHYDGFNKPAQIKLLEEMLSLATRLNLPVSLHVRDAFPDIFGILNNFPKLTGVFHSFSDSEENLKKVLERGFYVGVNGLATFANLDCYKNLERIVPLERILLETDAPFLTPVPKRGIINEPAYIKHIAEWLSAKLGVSLETITEKTTENVRTLFSLPNPEL